jgi:ribonuclease T1
MLRVAPWRSSVGGLLSLLIGLSVWYADPAQSQHRDMRDSGGTALLRDAPQSAVSPAEPPQKARDLLQALQARNGEPLPGYTGGREFRNRERRLPRGRYREYDVNPRLRGRPRDAERIVIDQRTGKAYYTPDHYQTFVPLN